MIIRQKNKFSIKGILLTVVLSMLCLHGSLYAVEVTDLYQAQVIVNDQSEAEKIIGLQEGLKQVLIKTSGQEPLPEEILITKALSEVTNFVLTFSYIKEEEHYLLKINYAQDRVNQLLQTARIEQWGSRRPQILTWLAIEEQGQRYIVGNDSKQDWLKQFREKMQARGLPFVLPIMDLNDHQSVHVADVWGGFATHITEYAARYPHDEIILARLYQYNDELWQLDWRIYRQGSTKLTGTNINHTDKIMIDFVREVANHYASEYAIYIRKQSKATLTLKIKGLYNLQQLIMAETRLESLAAVTYLELLNLNQQEAEFNLQLTGTEQDIIDALSLDSQFEKIYDPLLPSDVTQPLAYQWQP